MDPSEQGDIEMEEIDPFSEEMPIPEEQGIVHQTSPDIFGQDWVEDDDATQSQMFFETGDSDNDVPFLGYGNKTSRASPDIFADDWSDDETQSQRFIEQRGVDNDDENNGERLQSCSSPVMFAEYLDEDDNLIQQPMTNPVVASSSVKNDDFFADPIHLITTLKEQGVSDQNINTLCDSGFDTVEAYIFASTNDRYELPGLDETSKVEIETAAKAIVPDLGFTQATQIHRAGESQDMFAEEIPADQLPSSSATSAPARRIHLISELEMPSPEMQQTLIKSGYVSAESLLTATISEVMRNTKLSKQIVVQLQNAAREIVPDFGFTQTMQLYRRKTEEVFITTGSASIDKLLHGGIATGYVTQIFGESGSGKTQLCLSLAVNCQIPRSKSGAEGKCMYLDTRNTFRTERLVSIAKGLNMNSTSVLDNIAYANVKTTGQQSVLLHQAPSLLCSGSYALLIVDDIISLYKEEYSNASEIAARQIQLTLFLKSLINLANQYGVAVVFANQVVRQLDPKKDLFGENIPAGGKCVALVSDTIIKLTKGSGGCRMAAIYDPEDQQDETAKFCITAGGIADE